MTHRRYWAVNVFGLWAALLVSLFVFWVIRDGLWGFAWHHDHYDGLHNQHTITSPSIYFRLLACGTLALVYTVGLCTALGMWWTDHHIKWWQTQAWRRERNHLAKEAKRDNLARQRDQARLRELALVAAEHDVYDAIAKGTPVKPETAALLRAAERTIG